jgi:hypothetical protein
MSLWNVCVTSVTVTVTRLWKLRNVLVTVTVTVAAVGA